MRDRTSSYFYFHCSMIGPFDFRLFALTVLTWLSLAIVNPTSARAENLVDASEVPVDAAWSVLIPHVDASDATALGQRVVLNHLTGIDLTVVAKVNAYYGNQEWVVAGATVVLTLGDQRIQAVTGDNGLASVTANSGNRLGQHVIGVFLVGNATETFTHTLNVYDYVVVMPATINISNTGDNDGLVLPQLQRLELDADGIETLSSPDPDQLAIDMAAVRFIGSYELELDGDQDRSRETRLYEAVPDENGQLRFAIRSQTPGTYQIRAVGIGGRFRLRDDTLATMRVVVNDGPLDVALEFGPAMQRYLNGPDTIIIDDIATDEDTPIELDIIARVNGLVSGGVDVRVDPAPGAVIHLAGRIMTSDATDGSVHPSVWRPGPGPQTLTISANGSNTLTVIIVGLEADDGIPCGRMFLGTTDVWLGRWTAVATYDETTDEYPWWFEVSKHEGNYAIQTHTEGPDTVEIVSISPTTLGFYFHDQLDTRILVSLNGLDQIRGTVNQPNNHNLPSGYINGQRACQTE